MTTGKYGTSLNKGGKEISGETVQVIPHITNEIKDFIYKAQEESGADIMICEIGGTTGDIESLPFPGKQSVRLHRIREEKTVSFFITFRFPVSK